MTAVLERLGNEITTEAIRRVEKEFEGFDLPHELWREKVEFEEDSIIDSIVESTRDQ